MSEEQYDGARVVACQHGARRRYAVPRMLEQAGVLERFYTDSTAHSPLGRFAALWGNRASAVMKRLVNRRVNGVPADKLRSIDYYNLSEIGQRMIGRSKTGIELFRQRDSQLSASMIKRGVGRADIVYSMYHENLDFIKFCKDQGLGVVLDVYINPMTHTLMKKEYQKFPHWGGCPADDAIVLEDGMWKEAAALADILVCPSEWVAQGVRELTPEATDKIRIIPYGCSIDYEGRVNQPVPGRILFAGGYPLRKGLRYLAMAATQLKKENPEIEIRVAGLFPETVTGHPICKDLVFLGKLEKGQMQREYLSSDCFVLPSLSEGFAGVIAESIGAGCPVVVTRESGAPIIEGREGLFFEAADVDSMVSAVRKMVEDRSLRDSCSQACIERASFFGEEAWRERLIPAVLEAYPARKESKAD